MEKKILKKQKEVDEAKDARGRRKVMYDSQVVIVEGQRDVVRELEARSEIMLRDFVDADNKVKELLSEQSLLAQQLEESQEKEL
jgi:hypothetical protein